jgi:AcrR family transcriptional regulator
MSSSTKDRNREKIIDAATIAFGKNGYRKTKLEDIALITKKVKTSIYYYFKNKDEVFCEVIRQEADIVKKKIIAAIETEHASIDKFVKYVYVRMEAFDVLGNFYNSMRAELLERLPFINQNRIEFDEEEVRVVSLILKEGVDSGQFNISDIVLTAKTIVLTLKSLEIPFFGPDKQPDIREILDNLIAIFLRGILNHQKAN